MKILEILLTFLTSQGKSFVSNGTEALTRQIVNNARQVLRLVTILVISISLFCIGFSMGYSAIVRSFEVGDGWATSPSFFGGLILAALSLAGLVYSLGEDRWLSATGVPAEEPKVQQPQGPTLDGAFALLVTELAMQLKETRKDDPEPTGETPQV